MSYKHGGGVPLRAWWKAAAVTSAAGGHDEEDDTVTALADGKSLLLFDESAWLALEHRWVAELRGRGALAVMLVALVSLAYNQLTEGRFADAEVTLVEGRELSEATGFRSHLGLFECARLHSLAGRGREAEAPRACPPATSRLRRRRPRARHTPGAGLALPT